ncbi:MAG TPA: amino acid permease [Caulobacteraceae bacterium]|jgi:APA family basic amino acid/polyamine antiporter
MAVDAAPSRGGRLTIKKSIDQVQREATSHAMKRTLGPLNLVMLGIGCIIGAGIYVITGSAAANFAGPAVMLSFVIAGLACAFAGLCYAELASTMPVAGSAYTYSYTTLGEVFAWIMGWLLVLEYGVAAATVAAGWSGNVVSLFAQFGADIPAAMATSFINAVPAPEGGLTFQAGGGFNIVAALGILAVTALLVIGVSESATVNNFIVFIKVGILLLFIGMGVAFVNADNWVPFIPENEGGFTYGLPGVFRAASVIFFAYVGFEAVSTAAAEAKNPGKDMPVGILGSLVVCTIIYMATAAVLTGIVPYRELGVPAPIALAVDRMGMPWFSILIKVGTIAGLSSVMLILTYGQSRIFYAMARDGLLPRVFSRLHAKFRTPWLGTIILGILIAVAASLLPITILGDLVSLGTATAFGIVCLSVMHLRRSRPDLRRPFRVPFGPVIPILGILFSFVMIAPLVLDIVGKAATGDPIPAILLTCYALIGAAIYAFYGVKNSHLARGVQEEEDYAGTPPYAADLVGIRDGDA